MRCLSVKEPFASLIKEGVKKIETRSWKTNYRGEVYIHASLKKINEKDERISNLLMLIPNVDMQYGKIICKCRLIDCVYMSDEFVEKMKNNDQEYLCGYYEVGRYAWILELLEVLDEPISARGKLGIWYYSNINN